MIKRISLATAALLAATAPAFAHLGPAGHGSFMAGLSHPLFGPDHVLAMIAVGLWATMAGARRVWIVPAAFVGAMVAGFLLALGGTPLPFVEPAILASVVALGLLIATAVRLPAAACAAVVGLFALFHGHAHGGEIGAAGALAYGAGFVLSTALLHVAGIGLGMLGKPGAPADSHLSRMIGAGTAVAGIALMVG